MLSKNVLQILCSQFFTFFSDVEQSFEILDAWVFLELFCFIMRV